MTLEEFQNHVNDIRSNLDDVAHVTEVLNTLASDYTEMVKTNNSLTENNNKLIKDNDNLRNVNMELFLKVGEKRTNDNKNNLINTEEDKKDIPSFESLFDKEGNLL